MDFGFGHLNQFLKPSYELGREVGAMEERRRIARELHDELAQRLALLHMRVVKLKMNPGVTEVREELENIRKLAEQAYEGTRAAISRTQKKVPDGPGLLTLIKGYLQEFTDETQITAELVIADERSARLFPLGRSQLISILKEALTNAQKHAKATHVSVTFEMEKDTTKITIQDNGCGFKAEDQTRDKWNIHGLGIMRERAVSAAGMLSIESLPGKGTKLTVLLPTRVGEPNP